MSNLSIRKDSREIIEVLALADIGYHVKVYSSLTSGTEESHKNMSYIY